VSFKKSELSAEELGKVIESGSEGIWVVDGDGITKYTNPALNAMLGYGPSEIIGRSSFDFFLFDDSTSFEPFAINMDQGKVERYEIKILRKNKSHCWAMLGSSPMFEKNGEKKGSIFMVTDITERKNNEKILEENKAKAAHQTQMSALGEMAAGIAHEINTPLSAIIGKLGLLKSKLSTNQVIEPSEILKSLESIESTSFRIANIIKGMRAVSRSVDGLPHQAVSLKSIISETMLLCAEGLKSSNLNFEVSGDSEFLINCQPVQITQVLLNLIRNSFDATRKLASPWIRVETEVVGEWITIAVTDSGTGISPEIAKRIMEPFFTTKEVGKGTGLGLSVSASIIKEHEGTLEYDSSCANTRFVIRLPKSRMLVAKDDVAA